MAMTLLGYRALMAERRRDAQRRSRRRRPQGAGCPRRPSPEGRLTWQRWCWWRRSA